VRGTPPSDDALKRMFGPVPSPAGPDGENPSVGGLGMSPARLMAGAAADWDYWDPDSSSRPTFDDCAWQ
jgi:hypothetical protein